MEKLYTIAIATTAKTAIGFDETYIGTGSALSVDNLKIRKTLKSKLRILIDKGVPATFFDDVFINVAVSCFKLKKEIVNTRNLRFSLSQIIKLKD